MASISPTLKRAVVGSDFELAQALHQAGIVPQTIEPLTQRSDESITTWMIRCWEVAALTLPTHRLKQARQRMAELKALDATRCRIARIRFPNDIHGTERLVFAPAGWPTAPLLAVLSSRMIRKLDFEQAWLAALREVTQDASTRQHSLLTVAGTTADRLVRRCGHVFQIPVIVVTPGRPLESMERWFERVLQDSVEQTASDGEMPLFVSAPSSCSSSLTSTKDVPEADRLLAELADELVALSVRPGGHCWSLLRQQLSLPDQRVRRVRVVPDARLTRPAVLAELQSWGAELVECHPVVALVAGPNDNKPGPQVLPSATDSPTHPMIDGDSSEWSYLCHWTRGLESLALRDMPDELVDEWLMQPSEVDRTALATLLRMLASNRLKAHRLSATNPIPVVCFSASPLPELLNQRIYRPHRTRWDAEPFGFCIRRTVLEKLGARTVVYGTSTDLAQLPDGDRPWFQVRSSLTPGGQIDWSSEREWRLPGDLNLDWIAPGDAFVFVKSAEDAERIRSKSRWPVVVTDCEVGQLRMPK